MCPETRLKKTVTLANFTVNYVSIIVDCCVNKLNIIKDAK